MTKEIIVKISDELEAKFLEEYRALVSELVDLKKDKLPNITKEDSVSSILERIEETELQPKEKEHLKVLKDCSRIFKIQGVILDLDQCEKKQIAGKETKAVKEEKKVFDIQKLRANLNREDKGPKLER